MTDLEKLKLMSIKIIAVDFDHTLTVDGEFPNIGRPNTRLIQYLINCRKHGIKVILNTMREGEILDHAVEWCKAQGLLFDAVNDNLPEMQMLYGNNPRKIAATWYIDDHNAVVKGLGMPLPDLSKYGKKK